MYVIFPLDQLLDIDSADKNKSKKDLKTQSGGLKRQSVEVLTPTHPGQKQLPGQQPLTSPLNQSPAVLSVKQTPQDKVVSRSSSSSPVKSPSTLPLPPGGSQPYQQQVSNSSCSGASSLGSPFPTFSLNFPIGSSPVLGLKKKVTPSVSWAGPTCEDEKLSRSPSTHSNRDELGKNSTVSLSGRSSEGPKGLIVKSEIPRSQLIYSDSFRSYKELLKTSSLPRDERTRNKFLKSSEPVIAESKSEVLIPKDSRPVSLVRKESSRSLKPDSKTDIKIDLGGSFKSKLKPEPPPKLRLFDPGQELSEFGLFTGGSESVGLEGSFSNSETRSWPTSGLVRGASTKSTRGVSTLPSPSPQPPPSPSRLYARSDMAGDPSFKDLTHPSLNETLKSHNSVTFKLIKTVSDFSAQLSHLHERHAEDLQHLVENFRKKHSDLRNEKAPCASLMFQAWESLLQEVEVDSQLHSDVAGTLIRQVSRPLIEKTFHRKIQSRKLFTHRESIETILAKTEEMLKKCRKDHMEAYQAHCRTQNNTSLAAYFDAHNAYVQQLYATNAMLHFYNTNSLPGLLQELEEIYIDVGNVFIDSILQGSDILSVKAQEQNKRYDALNSTCKIADPHTDVACFVKYFDTPQLQQKGIPQHRFILPQPPAPPEGDIEEPTVQEPPVVPPLRNELVLDRLAALSSRSRVESLKKEGENLEKQIAALQEGMEALLRVQQRNLESCLYHKANELQEDISMKRFDLRVNQVHLSAVKAQKELFASKECPNSDSRERKMSNSSTGSMKSKWMKAFKSLKPPSGGGSGGPSGGATGRDVEKKNGRDRGEGRGDRGFEAPATLFENSHILQEYTYKKITACDVCHQILRGHSRQGLKCRLCKTNVHFECQERLPRCAPKSRLLRRQRSTSEIESKQIDAGDDDEPEININMLIASQPGRRMKDPPSPSTPTSATAPMLPPYKGASPVNPAGRNPV